MASQEAVWTTPDDWSEWSDWLAMGLHGRNRWRLGLLFSGILLAFGRRTVSTWLRSAGISDDYQDYYYFLSAVGRKCGSVGTRLLLLLIRKLPLPERVLLVIDDSPTKRYGKHVEGADIHHNPTPGPSDQLFLYGHVWVAISLAVRHPLWGPIGLPLRAMLYVRQKTMSSIPLERGWRFATKLQLAARLVEWAVALLKRAGKKPWVVIDGGYTKRPFLRRAIKTGATVVGRLRRDAALRSVVTTKPHRGKGRPRKYGKKKISLAKRAGQSRAWKTITCILYGRSVTKTYKTFIATYPPVGGPICVVIVREEHGWHAFFCSDPNAGVQEILEAFADRATIEQDFHDVKEVWGSGQQQVRNIWSNVAVYNLNLWMHTLVELWAWNRSRDELIDRSASPWDDPLRRPSHADRRKALRRHIMQRQLSVLGHHGPLPRKFIQLAERLIALAG